MSRFEKLLKRFLSRPKDFSYDELRMLLSGLGYRELKGGRTSGSRAAFVHLETGHIIRLHRPHPAGILKAYQITEIETTLRFKGMIP